MAYIYKITNLLNNKIYIGQTTRDLETRFREHQKNISAKSKSIIRDAIKLYGKENFIIELIEECPQEQANGKERYWIKFYNTYEDKTKGYNLTPGGDGRTLSDEQINKILFLWDAGKSVPEISEELNIPRSTVYHRLDKTLQFDRKENLNRSISKIEKPIVQYDLQGRPIKTFRSINEAERITGISSKQIGQARREGYVCKGFYWQFINEPLKIKTNKRKVYQYSLNKEYIQEFAGAREAVRILKVDPSSIIKCCNKKQKTCKGFIFSYEKLN